MVRLSYDSRYGHFEVKDRFHRSRRVVWLCWLRVGTGVRNNGEKVLRLERTGASSEHLAHAIWLVWPWPYCCRGSGSRLATPLPECGRRARCRPSQPEPSGLHARPWPACSGQARALLIPRRRPMVTARPRWRRTSQGHAHSPSTASPVLPAGCSPTAAAGIYDGSPARAALRPPPLVGSAGSVKYARTSSTPPTSRISVIRGSFRTGRHTVHDVWGVPMLPCGSRQRSAPRTCRTTTVRERRREQLLQDPGAELVSAGFGSSDIRLGWESMPTGWAGVSATRIDSALSSSRVTSFRLPEHP